MQPLRARCYLGLGSLYQRLGRRQAARQALHTALTQLRTLGMPYWLEQAKTVLT
jgi:hypothetical protein